MQIGVSLTTGFSRSLDARTAAHRLIERVQAIRAAGLDSLFVGDHHNIADHYFQNVPTIARLMADAGPMLTGALYLLPLHHPFLMAEQVGTMATLAEGPFAVIVAAGQGEGQFAPFGVSLRQRAGRMEEHLSLLRRLLAGERVTFDGRYHTLTDAVISPLPPEPVTVWVAGSARPALERAGRLGDGWVAEPGATGERLETAVRTYRDAALIAGRRPSLIIRRDIYVGESDAEAEEAVAPVLVRGYRGIDRTALIFGSPDTVLEEFRALHDLGFDHVLVRHIVPDQERVLASYRRLGAHVLPVAHAWARASAAPASTPAGQG